MRIRLSLLVTVAALTTGCGDPDRSDLLRLAESEGSLEEPNASEEGAAQADAIRMVFLGTSLTEGLGLERPSTEAWPARVGELADSAGISLEVLNSGLGGETSAGALRRLDWVMRQSPDLLVLETGANDGLRGLPLDQLESNLDEIVRRVQEEYSGVTVVLTQMEAPPNMGTDYSDPFHAVYPRIAGQRNVELLPFLLEGVAGDPGLNQRDGIHPTPDGHWIMARNAWPVLEEVLRSIGAN